VNYDLIGDIHGHSEPLAQLLDKLGYAKTDGVFRHADRQVIFLGDFVDRGPDQRGVLEIVRPMIDGGAALSVMGNHEFNAIAYHTLDPDNHSCHLRVHTEKNRKHYTETIEWFRTLPLWLELDGIRVVHACWDEALMKLLQDTHPSVNEYLDDDLLVAASRKGSEEYEAVETLLKGKEIELPDGQSFFDKDGNPRHNVRVRWFDGDAATYQQAFLGPEKARSHIPEDPIGADHLIQYSHEDPPVFLGHYWLDTEPQVLAPNVACLDYSVAAKSGGKLVAYRWDGERRLDNDKFVFVERGSE
jgi:hypothetical protein